MQAWVFLLATITSFIAATTSGELIVFQNGTSLFCAISGGNSSAPLAWIPHRLQHPVTQSSFWIPKISPEYSILTCNLSDVTSLSDHCPMFNNDDWEIVSTWGKDTEQPLLDQHWNDLKIHRTNQNQIDEKYVNMKIPDERNVFFQMSVLATDNLHISLANSAKTEAYRIVIDGWVKSNNGSSTAMELCKGDIESCKIFSGLTPGRHLGNGTTWTNIGIKFKILNSPLGVYFQIFDDRNNEIVSYRPTIVIKVAHLLIRTRNIPGIIKFISYNGLKPKSGTSHLVAPFTTAKETKSLCISVNYELYGEPGTMELSSEETNTIVHSIPLNPGRTRQELRTVFTVNPNTRYTLTIKPPREDYQDFVINGIRVCNQKETFISRMDGTKSGTCMDLQSNKKLSTNGIDSSRFIYECPRDSFGPDCSLHCSDLFEDAGCTGVSVCNSAEFCSCVPGYYGGQCKKRCPMGYGTTCTQCGQCRNTEPCDVLSGDCKECEAGWKLPSCRNKCDPGSYGLQCNEECSEYCEDNAICDHRNGTCPSGCQHGWRPPLCHQIRARLSSALKLEKNYVDHIKVKIGDIKGSDSEIASISLQYRKSQNTGEGEHSNIAHEWKKGPFLAWNARLTVSLKFIDLQPDTSYEFRAVLIERDEGSYTGDNIPILNYRTLCRPANQDQITITSEMRSMKVHINVEHNTGDCEYHSYSVSVDNGAPVSLSPDFSAELTELEPQTEYMITVTTVTLIHSYTKCTLDLDGMPPPTGYCYSIDPTGAYVPIIAAVLVILAITLAVSVGAFWWRHKRAQKEIDREILHVNRELGLKAGGITAPADLLAAGAPRRPSNRSQMSVSFSNSLSTNSQRHQTALPIPSKPIRTASQDFPPAPSHSHLVAVADLQDYVQTANESGLLKSQHELFPRGQTASWVEGRRPEHKGKNRYGNLVAYDETRVHLTPLPNQPHSHYINANYIDGYKSPRAYIATQGPKEKTLGDFWRMIWQENVSTIVMLANVIENGKVKCEQYWPDVGSEERVMGGVSVITVSQQILLYYTVREMRVTKDNDTRTVVHLHYTTWPDHGVPRYIYTVTMFIRHVMAVLKPSTPLVVHCSAGVGRTGTVILAHASLQMAIEEDGVDLLALLSTIRSQRPNMVDNHDQYVMAHEVLLELLFVDDTVLPCNKLSANIQNLKEDNGFYEEFANLDDACQNDTVPLENFPWSQDKNRFMDIVPVSSGRVILASSRGDYINAVYVDGVVSRGRYIVTQLPLPNTLEDLWLMMWQKASILLLLNLPDPAQDKSTCEIFPADHSELWVSATMRISVLNVSERKIFQIRTILIKNNENVNGVTKTGRREVMVISMRGWVAGNAVPTVNPQDIVQLWDEVDRQRKDTFPVVVACHDGASACGVYVAAGHMLEGMRLTGKVDVGGAMRCVRHNRPQLVTCHEQYKFLYDVAQAYLDMYDTYVNFQ